MISEKNYEALKENYGLVSSWAIWGLPNQTPKSNTNSMEWVNEPNLLNIINTGFVFVGLNAAGTHGYQEGHFENAWANFHSGYRFQNDYKLRYALMNTKYWGSYITDVIKHYEEVDSGEVKRYLNKHPEVVEDNICLFEEELQYLGGNPILVALGGETYKILCEHLRDKYKIVRILHYSYTISKEDYRKKVLGVLDNI